MFITSKIDKKKFIEIMDTLKGIAEAEEKITEALALLGTEGFFSTYKSTHLIEEILQIEFEDKENDWIGYFMYELEFGKNYHDGSITESDGEIVKMSNASELYDVLIYNIYQKEINGGVGDL